MPPESKALQPLHPSYIFEILNDFLAFGEPDQLLKYCTDMEIVYFPILDIDITIAGSEAPAAMRRAVRSRAEKKISFGDRVALNPTHVTNNDGAAIFDLEVIEKGEKRSGTITLITSVDSIRGLIYTPVSTKTEQKSKVKNEAPPPTIVQQSPKLKKQAPQVKKRPAAKTDVKTHSDHAKDNVSGAGNQVGQKIKPRLVAIDKPKVEKKPKKPTKP